MTDKIIFSYDELKVIGVIDQDLEPQRTPRFFEGIYAVRKTGFILYGYEKSEDTIVTSAPLISEQDLEELVRQEGTTWNKVEEPFPAAKDYCLYIKADRSKIEYLSYTQIHSRLVIFSDKARNLGDDYFRKSDIATAQQYWSDTADISQDASDYARLCLCDSSLERLTRLKDWIKGQGKDPEKLIEQVRVEINNQ